MKIVLLRVGIDTGSGGFHGPLFQDGSFEFIYMHDKDNIDNRTYASLKGKHKRKLIGYFPIKSRQKMADQRVHVDPEFTSYTYGDPTRPKAKLRTLQSGDMLVFYCGLEGWGRGFKKAPALYLIGYFDVLVAGIASDFDSEKLYELFAENYHVRHKQVFEKQKNDLVLVKGSPKSRLFKKAVQISSIGKDKAGKNLHILSPEAQKVFGDFDGKLSIQRSPPRWIADNFIQKAKNYILGLE